ncbi:RHS repeat-associated core domain-containing protein, partial [[Clostridium] leptum]
EYRISYDDQNRIDATLEKIAGVTLKNEYQYSDTSIIKGVKLNGSQILTYDWDDLTRMTSRTLNLTAPFTTQYTYLKGSNAGGETALVAEIKNGGETLRYAYDQFGNIASVSKNGAVIESYEYDGLNQLIKVTNGANVTEYAYDTGGNLTSVKLNGEVQDTYGYTDAGWKDLLTSFNGQAITYDEIGNPLTYRDGFTFTWQNGRRLATVSHGNDSISYTYDPDGIRTSKTVNGTTTKDHVMNGTLLGQTKGSDTIVFLYDEKANRYGFDYNGTKYYYIFNVKGDVIGILNQSGTQIVSYQYDPWGKVLSVSGSEASTIGQFNPIRYRGYYYDTETGFYYLQSRYYDPTTRRFLNADGIVGANQDAICYNLFAYCSNNPIMLTDESGNRVNMALFNKSKIRKSAESAIPLQTSPQLPPLQQFGAELYQDVVNFNINNTSEEKVIESNWVSAYKGKVVIRHPIKGLSSMSLGVIFLNKNETEYNTVRHEYGHCVQLDEVGMLKYLVFVAGPSVKGYWSGLSDSAYYSQPWEYGADMYGGVDRGDGYYEDSTLVNHLMYWDMVKKISFKAPIRKWP